MLKPVRRVVTGHNDAGKSVFLMDGPAPAVFTRGTGSTTSTILWETDRTPADNSGSRDPTVDHPHRLPPPQNGSCFRVVDYPPDKERVAALRQDAQAQATAAGEGYVRDTRNPRHPGFHKTNTIDYAIVVAGEIWALMDEGEVLLKAGDVLIQRGTSHAWSNRSDAPARVMFVLIDAKPV